MFLSNLPGYQEVANEKGILEQSEITLVSLTDTTLQDQETTITEEEGIEHVKGAGEEAQRGQKTEVTRQMPVVQNPSFSAAGVFLISVHKPGLVGVRIHTVARGDARRHQPITPR